MTDSVDPGGRRRAADEGRAAGPAARPRLVATGCLLLTLALATPVATLLAALATALARLARRPDADTASHTIVRGWARLLVASAGTRVRVRGLEHLPRGPAVIICNHLSAADSFLIAALIRHDMRFVARHDIFRLLWIMHLARYIPVNRGRGRDWRRISQSARTFLARGVSITIFPEGRRSRSGRLQAFHGGAFRIALDSGVPIVPLVIEGTGEVLPPEGVMLRAGEVRLTVLPAIYPAPSAGEDRRRLARRVHALYTAAVAPAPANSAPTPAPTSAPHPLRAPLPSPAVPR